MVSTIVIRAFFDKEAKVWVATSNDISGLYIEADTMEILLERIPDVLADLIECNDYELNSDLPDIPYHVMAEQTGRITKAHA